MLKKKIHELFIGSNNKGKVREIKQLLPKYINVHSTIDYKLRSPKENGKTFLQNSYIKSKYFSKKTGKICLADDSGLEIDILNKAIKLKKCFVVRRPKSFIENCHKKPIHKTSSSVM